jgi:hypothetical protein
MNYSISEWNAIQASYKQLEDERKKEAEAKAGEHRDKLKRELRAAGILLALNAGLGALIFSLNFL